ncbi:MAG: dinitrogenase iron-molybdenum cofactor biosynthesis protein, partial [Candidatus Marinimicrobia bacterium]|nr:dinitrogenase iron-molybdenum cofactor biosynthesis protein [Candidatus Neomarinimicrobiota bacterium]
MKTLRAAFATNDGEHFINEHYGDAEKYVIYDISQDSSSLVATVANKSKDFKEEGHADPNKAMGIAGNFREHKPQ